MSRGADERAGQSRAGPAHVLRPAWPEVTGSAPSGPERPTLSVSAPRHTIGRQRTEREREGNRRLERAEEVRAAWRIARPTAPEQQMMSVLATLGERYGEDYLREHKIKEGDWYVTHVDFAFPASLHAIVRWNLGECQELPASSAVRWVRRAAHHGRGSPSCRILRCGGSWTRHDGAPAWLRERYVLGWWWLVHREWGVMAVSGETAGWDASAGGVARARVGAGWGRRGWAHRCSLSINA